MFRTPSELSFLGVYVPPFFLVCLVGLVVTLGIACVMNRVGGNRWVWHPPLAFTATWVLTSSILGLFVLAP